MTPRRPLSWMTIFGGLAFATLYFSLGNALLVGIQLGMSANVPHASQLGTVLLTAAISAIAIAIPACLVIFSVGAVASIGIEVALRRHPRRSIHFLAHLAAGFVLGCVMLGPFGDVFDFDNALVSADRAAWIALAVAGLDCAITGALGWLTASLACEYVKSRALRSRDRGPMVDADLNALFAGVDR